MRLTASASATRLPSSSSRHASISRLTCIAREAASTWEARSGSRRSSWVCVS